jgi:hypothetical protein
MITLIIKEGFFPLKFKCIFENIPDDVNTLCEKFLYSKYDDLNWIKSSAANFVYINLY